MVKQNLHDVVGLYLSSVQHSSETKGERLLLERPGLFVRGTNRSLSEQAIPRFGCNSAL